MVMTESDPGSFARWQGVISDYMPSVNMSIVKERCVGASTIPTKSRNGEEVRDDQSFENKQDLIDDERTSSYGIGLENSTLPPLLHYFQWNQGTHEPESSENIQLMSSKTTKDDLDLKVKRVQTLPEKCKDITAVKPKGDSRAQLVSVNEDEKPKEFKSKFKDKELLKKTKLKLKEAVIAEAFAACAEIDPEATPEAPKKNIVDNLKERLTLYLDEQMSNKHKKHSRRHQKEDLKKQLRKCLKKYLKENPVSESKKDRKVLQSTMEKHIQQMVNAAVDQNQDLQKDKKSRNKEKKDELKREKSDLKQKEGRLSAYEELKGKGGSPKESLTISGSLVRSTAHGRSHTKPLETPNHLPQSFTAAKNKQLWKLEQTFSREQLQEVSSVVSESIRQLQGENMSHDSSDGVDEDKETYPTVISEEANPSIFFNRLYKFRQQTKEFESRNEIFVHEIELKNDVESILESKMESITALISGDPKMGIKTKHRITSAPAPVSALEQNSPQTSTSNPEFTRKMPAVPPESESNSSKNLISSPFPSQLPDLSKDTLLMMRQEQEQVDTAIVQEMAKLHNLQTQFLKKAAIASAAESLEEEFARLRDTQTSLQTRTGIDSTQTVRNKQR